MRKIQNTLLLIIVVGLIASMSLMASVFLVGFGEMEREQSNEIARLNTEKFTHDLEYQAREKGKYQLEDLTSYLTDTQPSISGTILLLDEEGAVLYGDENVLGSDNAKVITASEEGTPINYEEEKISYTAFFYRLDNGMYLVLATEEEVLYSRQYQIIYSVVVITILVLTLLTAVITGLIFRTFHKARRDVLTGAHNRASYMEQVQEIDNIIGKTRNDAFAVALFDINGLKRMNDLNGHSAGDSMIKEAYDGIRHYFPGEVIYRLGGDEFAIIAKPSNVTILVEEVHYYRQIMDEKTKLIQNGEEAVVVSVGLAVEDMENDHCYDDVFKKADAQMYEMKNAFYEKAPEYKR